tara:strand:- start:699 stop:848 length:150 start_codon:yes stop_codon:yes gene_type:complete
VRRAKPAINIIKAANLYLEASDPLLSKNVSEAKEKNVTHWALKCQQKNA